MIEDQRQPLIEMDGISKVFRTPAGDFTALKNVSVNFYQGEFVGILGKSGSGKSTLVNMITGIDHPTRGRVRVSGIDIHHLPESRMAIWRGKNLGVVFQFFQLLPMISVIDNLLLPMDLCGLYPVDARVDRAFDLLRLVGMEDYADKKPNELAGGQQQSVAIARALANDPPIIAADEPTGNLDSGTADAVFGIFEELIKRNKTIIMVTHDPALAKRTSRRVLLCDGEIIHPLVAEALPALPHRQMLEITLQLQSHLLQAGEMALKEGERPGFCLVQSGVLEVVQTGVGAGEKVVRRIQPGEFFCDAHWRGLVDSNRNRRMIVRSAAEGPAEVLSMEGNVFDEMLSTSAALNHLVQSSAAEWIRVEAQT